MVEAGERGMAFVAHDADAPVVERVAQNDVGGGIAAGIDQDEKLEIGEALPADGADGGIELLRGRGGLITGAGMHYHAEHRGIVAGHHANSIVAVPCCHRPGWPRRGGVQRLPLTINYQG